VKRLAALLLALATACGGGGGSGGNVAIGPVIPAPPLRADLLFGYYGENAVSVTETSGHANLAWCADFYGPLEQMACLTQAKGLGMKAVMMLPVYPSPCTPSPPSDWRFWFKRLADVGLLDTVVAIYPVDEPTCDAAMIRATNAQLRDVMSEFPPIAQAKLAVIYACKAGFPGAETYDVIGCDDYDSGSAVLTRYYPALAAANPGARLIVVPGGADPWRADPAPFESYAHGTARVWALVPFIWQSADGHDGIRDNGMATLYCIAGREIVTGAPAVC
jgi:hypothetical protein